jgi:hypothetical protein
MVGTAGIMLGFSCRVMEEPSSFARPGSRGRLSPHEDREIKWAGNQEAVTFLGYRPIRS